MELSAVLMQTVTPLFRPFFAIQQDIFPIQFLSIVFHSKQKRHLLVSTSRIRQPRHHLLKAMSKAGMSVCASQKEKTSLGPVMRSYTSEVRVSTELLDDRGTTLAYLGHKSLEEAGESLVLGHIRQDSETALRVLKVSVLDTSLDDI